MPTSQTLLGNKIMFCLRDISTLKACDCSAVGSWGTLKFDMSYLYIFALFLGYYFRIFFRGFSDVILWFPTFPTVH